MSRQSSFSPGHHPVCGPLRIPQRSASSVEVPVLPRSAPKGGQLPRPRSALRGGQLLRPGEARPWPPHCLAPGPGPQLLCSGSLRRRCRCRGRRPHEPLPPNPSSQRSANPDGCLSPTGPAQGPRRGPPPAASPHAQSVLDANLIPHLCQPTSLLLPENNPRTCSSPDQGLSTQPTSPLQSASPPPPARSLSPPLSPPRPLPRPLPDPRPSPSPCGVRSGCRGVLRAVEVCGGRGVAGRVTR